MLEEKDTQLTEQFKELFGSDTARILRFTDRMYLMIGHKRRSEGRWIKNGHRCVHMLSCSCPRCRPYCLA